MTDATFEKIWLILLDTAGITAPPATATNPAIRASRVAFIASIPKYA
jgi:hypothetical protein